jgi:hypothetical protein
MMLVKLRRADAKCSASKLLHTNFEADRFNISLEKKGVKFAVRQERHVAASKVKLY